MKKIIGIFLLLFLVTTGCLERVVIEEEKEDCKFEIEANVITTTGYNSYTSFDGEKDFVVPARALTVSDTIRELYGGVWYDPRIEFRITPETGPGSTTNDKATISFLASDYDQRVIASGGNYRLITKNGAWYKITWTCDSEIWYVEGEKTMFVMQPSTITLDFSVNKYAFSQMELFDKITIPLTFYNGDKSWSDSYNVTFMVSQQSST